MADYLTLSVLEAGHKELTVMRSLLNLAGSAEGEPSWQVSDEPGGDFTVVDVDSSAGRDLWESLDQQGQQPVALTRDQEFSAEYLLQKPLRSRAFLDLLNELVERPDDSTPLIAEPVAPVWESWEQKDDPQLATLAEHLRRQTWATPVIIMQPGWPELIIDLGSGTWYYDGSISDVTPRLFSEAIPASAGVPVSSVELADRVNGMNQRPLSELKWYAGLTQSRGKLHPDLVGEIQLMLTQAPAQAMEVEAFQRISRILIREPVTLDTLHEKSGEAVETVVSFLNACYTTGRLLVNQSARVVSF